MTENITPVKVYVNLRTKALTVTIRVQIPKGMSRKTKFRSFERRFSHGYTDAHQASSIGKGKTKHDVWKLWSCRYFAQV